MRAPTHQARELSEAWRSVPGVVRRQSPSLIRQLQGHSKAVPSRALAYFRYLSLRLGRQKIDRFSKLRLQKRRSGSSPAVRPQIVRNRVNAIACRRIRMSAGEQVLKARARFSRDLLQVPEEVPR